MTRIPLTNFELDKVQQSLLNNLKEDDLNLVLNVLRESHQRSYLRGFCDGLNEYAYWKDGVQYVGNCGITLQKATEQAVRDGCGCAGQNPFSGES
jgi:hypothetical protein